jgi:NarL family two-component system response regulator LiaR
MTTIASEPFRVVLADDHAIVRKGICEFLEEDGEITVVAEAADGREAVRLAGEHRPNVAVLDVQMPGINGIEATRQIKASYPDVRVLILTAYDDDPYVFALLGVGADGYVLKNTDADELVRAVKMVAAGGKVLAPDIAAKLIAQVTTDKPADLAHQGHFGLTGMRERTLLYGGQLTITSSSCPEATITARPPLLR